MSKLKIGDMVQLKSGGPMMTVNAIGGGQVNCVWFWDNERSEGVFAKGALELITTGSGQSVAEPVNILALNTIEAAHSARYGGEETVNKPF